MILCSFIKHDTVELNTKGDHPVVFDIKFCHFLWTWLPLAGKVSCSRAVPLRCKHLNSPRFCDQFAFAWCCSSVRTVMRWCSCCWRHRQTSRILLMMTRRYRGLVCLSVCLEGWGTCYFYYSSRLYSTFLCSRADSLPTRLVILNEWLSFFSVYF